MTRFLTRLNCWFTSRMASSPSLPRLFCNYYCTKKGPSPLHHAAFFGQVDRIQGYAKEIEKMFRGESVGKVIGRLKDDNGNTAFHCAALGGKTQVCDYFVNTLKVDTEVTNVHETTPLYEAIITGQIPFVICLLENGANPNASCKMGLTPLHLAAKQQGGQELIQLLISKGAEANAWSEYGGTPLVIAASEGQKDAVKILLDNHADPNASGSDKLSPLGAANCAKSIECVKLLLQAGANPNNQLEKAVLARETEIIKCLLAAGANPNARNAFDMTPLEVAAIKGLLDCVLVLFPVTAPIAGVIDWSVYGVMKYGQTDKAKIKMDKKKKEEFSLAKSKGEAALKRDEYLEAAKYFTECLSIEPSDATMLYNRSLCLVKLKVGGQALSDAQACISLRPDWANAYYQEGKAWNLMQNYKKAADSFLTAWKMDMDNKELKSAYYAALETQRRCNN